MSKQRWTTSGTSGQIFEYQGERLFYVTMVDGWHDQLAPTVERMLNALNATEPSRPCIECPHDAESHEHVGGRDPWMCHECDDGSASPENLRRSAHAPIPGGRNAR